ncbi:hypothetical protein DWU98_09350 [Dyella monticola]|uniref:Uncharacterized protein n=1 Tax=Dyella monticola TaxID=1927958 RepID=A0A370X1K2_9GAMM|nr:hypothetical protein DWU98_09350 [Dyella monticola]
MIRSVPDKPSWVNTASKKRQGADQSVKLSTMLTMFDWDIEWNLLISSVRGGSWCDDGHSQRIR